MIFLQPNTLLIWEAFYLSLEHFPLRFSLGEEKQIMIHGESTCSTQGINLEFNGFKPIWTKVKCLRDF